MNIVMIMPYRAYLEAAKAEGFRVYAIWDRSVAESIYGSGAGAYLAAEAEIADGLVVTDFADEDALRGTIEHALTEFDAELVYHVGQEGSMLLATRIAENLGLAANPATSIELLNDKHALRTLLAQHGVSEVRFAHAASRLQVTSALDHVGLPAVVKPTRLSGSRAVRLLERREDLAEWQHAVRSYGYDGPVLVEEYLTGPEYSVETMSVRGEHHLLGVTRKLLGEPPLFVETGHVHPEPVSAATEEMGQLAVQTLRLAGYRNGPAHTELKLTPHGPRVIESQARAAGDRIPTLVELASGVDLSRSIFRALRGEPPVAGEPRAASARIHYFDLPCGVVTGMGELPAIRDLPFVDDLNVPFGVGDVLGETVDWHSRHGYVIVHGDSPEHTASLAADVQSRLDVRVASTAPRGAVA